MQLCQIPYETARAAENMAIDAAMLEFGAATDQALWRLYGWSVPSVTFGYSQPWDWVMAGLAGFTGAVVRRMTGGGIVDHRNDLTYALSLPPSHWLYREPATALYRALHERIAAVLQDLGYPAALEECPGPCAEADRRPAAGVCFQAAEPYDVVDPVSRAKLAGAALKRSRKGLLVQGSLSLGNLPGLRAQAFGDGLNSGLAAWLQLQPADFTGSLPAGLLAAEWERFSSRDWNRRR